MARYPFLASLDADFHGALIGHALPGGIVARDSYEALADEIVARLASIVSSTSVDGLWYDIHGAMVVEGLDDAESDLLGRIRDVIGPDVIVSASMDLHGNVTAELAHQVDLVTCYRMAPHEDAMDTKERAVRNLVEVLSTRPVGSQRPVKAWVPIPVLLPGEQTSTRIEPAASLYAQVPEVEATDGVLDAAIWVGYAWADQPRDRAVTVVTGWDRDAVAAGAERLATRVLGRARGLRVRRTDGLVRRVPRRRAGPRCGTAVLRLRLGRQPDRRRLRRHDVGADAGLGATRVRRPAPAPSSSTPACPGPRPSPPPWPPGWVPPSP